MKFEGLTVGIPTEIMAGEGRVAGIPETVGSMIREGARVLIQAGAGRGAFIADQEYEAVGAQIAAQAEDVYSGADIILKVKEPRHDDATGRHELDMMRAGQHLVAFLHPASPANHQMVRRMAAGGIVGLTLDGIPRIPRAQIMDALTSMSTVAGYKAVLMAAEKLRRFVPMMGTALGPLPPANIVVVGTGVAGLQALTTAKRLGAQIQGADIRPEACEQARTLGAAMIDTGVPPELAIGDGGYAKRLPKEWLLRERDALRDSVAGADVLVLASLVPGRMAPVLVTEDMVKSMKPGSVIVDVAVDQGGNCGITAAGTTVEKYGVTIIGIQNIPGIVSASSTWMFSKNMYNFVAYVIHDGKVALDMADEIVRSTLVTKDSHIVHAGALEAMDQVQ